MTHMYNANAAKNPKLNEAMKPNPFYYFTTLNNSIIIPNLCMRLQYIFLCILVNLCIGKHTKIGYN